MSRLREVLGAARAAGRLAVFPYMTAGYPDDAGCERLLLAAARAGADGLEIGIPFSDPLADGVTLQRASQAALSGGANLGRAVAQTEVPMAVPMRLEIGDLSPHPQRDERSLHDLAGRFSENGHAHGRGRGLAGIGIAFKEL